MYLIVVLSNNTIISQYNTPYFLSFISLHTIDVEYDYVIQFQHVL